MPLEANSPLKRCLSALHQAEDGLLSLLLLSMIGLASLQIFLRNLFDMSFTWGDPLLRMLVLWVGLLGALAATRDDRQITVDVLSRVIRGRTRTVVGIVVKLFAASVSAIIAYHAGHFVVSDYGAKVVSIAGFPAWIFELILPFSFGLIALRYLVSSAVASFDLRGGRGADDAAASDGGNEGRGR